MFPLSKRTAGATIAPVALMRLTTIGNPNDLLKKYDKSDIVVEHKYDGFKIQIIKQGNVKLYSRRGLDKTANFPDLIKQLSFLPDNTFVEGEIVYEENGKEILEKVITLVNSSAERSQAKAKELTGKIIIYLYDILWYKGKFVGDKAHSERRKFLESVVKPTKNVLLSKQYPFDKWEEVMKEVSAKNGEGIVLKIKDKPYKFKSIDEKEPKPADIMFKYKGSGGKSDSDDFVIFDYKLGDKGKLKAQFGQYYKGKLYRISEISNFSKNKEEEIKKQLKNGPFVVEIHFQERTPKGLRGQNYVRDRDDKKPEDATMSKYHIEHVNELKEAGEDFVLSKRAGVVDDALSLLEKGQRKPMGQTTPSFTGLKSVPGVDVQKAYKIISSLESGNKYIIGDSGTSFGATQVQFGSFVNKLAQSPNVEGLTGLSQKECLALGNNWNSAKEKMKNVNLWIQTDVDENDVKAYIKQNPKSVVRRNEGTTIRYIPGNKPGVVKVKNGRYIGYVLDLARLKEVGLNVDSSYIIGQLKTITNEYITEGVVRNAIVRLFISQENPDTYAKFQKAFSKRNVNSNQEIRNLADKVVQQDFMNRVTAVTSAVGKAGYNTSASNAYNIYQLIAVSNAAGVGAVQTFLFKKKPFSSAQKHYLNRANNMIAKVTGIPTSFPADGLGGFSKTASLSKRAAAEDTMKIQSPFLESGQPSQEEILYALKLSLQNFDALPDRQELFKKMKQEFEEELGKPLEPKAVQEMFINMLREHIIKNWNTLRTKKAEFKISKRASEGLTFPGEYAEDIKSGKKTLTIRMGEVPFQEGEIVKCISYSGAEICDVKILSKKIMSTTRIRKAYGKYLANSLEQRFGPDKRYMVIKFEVAQTNLADDNEKWDEVLIEKDGTKLTRQQIRDHYEKPEIRKRILVRIKDKPILIYIGTAKNESILKRKHNDKDIIITNANPATAEEDPHNYLYWTKRRLLSIHEVFGTKTDMGFIDLDLHGNYSLADAKKYAKALAKELEGKTTIYQSGGTGLHIEIELNKETDIDALRQDLKDLLTDFNQDWEGVTTGIVKGDGMRSDVSTLHNKGALRAPWSLGETYGQVKKPLGQDNDDSGNFGDLHGTNENWPPEDGVLANPPMPAPVDPHYADLSHRLTKEAGANEGIAKEFIWMWDDGYLWTALSVLNEKYLNIQHADLQTRSGLRRIEDDRNPRGFVTFYMYSWKKPLISTYAKPFEQLEDRVQRRVEHKFSLSMGEYNTQLVDSLFASFAPSDMLILQGIWKLAARIENYDENDETPTDEETNKFLREHGFDVDGEGSPKEEEEEEIQPVKKIKQRQKKKEVAAPKAMPVEKPKDEPEITPIDLQRVLREESPGFAKRQREELKVSHDILRAVAVRPAPLEMPERVPEGLLEELQEGWAEEEPPTEEPAKKEPEEPVKEEPVKKEILEEVSKEMSEEEMAVMTEALNTPVSQDTELDEQINLNEEDVDAADDEMNKLLNEFDIDEAISERERNLFNIKLEPLKDAKGQTLSSWPSEQLTEEEARALKITKSDIDTLYGEEGLKSGRDFGKKCSNASSWQLFREKPYLLQSLVLPIIMRQVGKIWFDKHSIMRELRGFDFGMFDKKDITSLDILEEHPKAKTYIAQINEILTAAVNKYFSIEQLRRQNTPLDGFCYKTLHHEMIKRIAKEHNYKESRLPVCAVCRANQPRIKGTVLKHMVPVTEGKVKLWTCEQCQRQTDILKEELIKIEKKLDNAGWKRKENFDKQMKVVIDKLHLAELNQHEPRIKKYKAEMAALQEGLNTLDVTVIDVETQKRNKKLNDLRAAQGQTKVPYIHTWCPNPDCPGQRVPLTAVDWGHDFWKTEEGQNVAKQLKSKFKVEGSQNISEDSQEATDKPRSKRDRRAAPSWMDKIPFICPHDNVKFIFGEVRNKGYENNAGYLHTPWQGVSWTPITGEDRELTERTPEPTETDEEKNKDKENKQFFQDLGKKAVDLFTKKWNTKIREISEYRIREKSRGTLDAAIKNSDQHKNLLRELALLDTARQMSVQSPEILVSWLNGFGSKKIYIKDDRGNIIPNSKITKQEVQDELFAPLIQNWVDDILKHDDGFNKYKLGPWLATEQDGIKHFVDAGLREGPGAYFVTKITGLGQQIGFKCNLKKKSRGSEAGPPKMLRISGLWVLTDEDIKLVKRLGDTMANGQITLNSEALIGRIVEGKQNKRSCLLQYNFYEGLLDTDISDILPDSYVLVRAMIIPGTQSHTALRTVRRLRDDKIFVNLRKLTAGEDDPIYWQNLTRLIQDVDVMEKLQTDILLDADISKLRTRMRQGKKVRPAQEVSVAPTVPVAPTPEPIVSVEEPVVRPPIKPTLPEVSTEKPKTENVEKVPQNIRTPKPYSVLRKTYPPQIKKTPKPYSVLRKVYSFDTGEFLSKRAALAEYEKKRDFSETAEPEPKVEKTNKHRFVIQKHDATNLHFDLRLENDEGTMSSWAIPKHKMPEGKEKLLAVKTEDHPVSYNKFEGTIEEGYGAGEVEIYDGGIFEEIEWTGKKIVFKLKGKKETATYNLIKTDGKNWLLMEAKEQEARDYTEEEKSILLESAKERRKLNRIMRREKIKLQNLGLDPVCVSSTVSGINIAGHSDIDFQIGTDDVKGTSEMLGEYGIPVSKDKGAFIEHTYLTEEGISVDLKVRPKNQVEYQLKGLKRILDAPPGERHEQLLKKYKVLGDKKEYDKVKHDLYKKYHLIPPDGDWDNIEE